MLPPMNSSQCHVIHSLAEKMGLAHASSGEGKDKSVVIERTGAAAAAVDSFISASASADTDDGAVAIATMWGPTLSHFAQEGALMLLPMNSFQRRVIHSLAEKMGLAHASSGEGKDKSVVIERSISALVAFPGQLPGELPSSGLSDGPGNEAHFVSLLAHAMPLLERLTPKLALFLQTHASQAQSHTLT